MTHRVAIVGAGPSGFYAADGLLRARPDLHVDIIDRLPTPYGLVRAGVAPDHQGTKAIVRQFEKLLQQPDVRFAGNIEVGRDLSWEELDEGYDAVIVATGMVVDRKLGVPGEDLSHVWGSWRFIGWLNGHPDCRSGPDLSAVQSVAVIGNGNVALDAARLLAKSAEEMIRSDIVPEAGAAIAAAPISRLLRMIVIVSLPFVIDISTWRLLLVLRPSVYAEAPEDFAWRVSVADVCVSVCDVRKETNTYCTTKIQKQKTVTHSRRACRRAWPS